MLPPPRYPLLTARDFLEIEFGDRKGRTRQRRDPDDGRGTARHAEVAGNIFLALGTRLRGSGCKPYTSDMATRTHDLSIRYPDVRVFCGREDPANDDQKAFDDPVVVVEVLSAGTARTDLRVKLEEYRALPSVDTIIYVDIATERVRVIQRTGAHGWTDVAHDAPFDTPLPALGITLPHDEMFARD